MSNEYGTRGRKRTSGEKPQHILYRWWDHNGNLLYVGQSITVWERVKQHRTASAWFGTAVAMTIEELPTKTELDKAERQAIENEHPVHNITHNQTPGTVRQIDPRTLIIHAGWVNVPLDIDVALESGELNYSDYVRILDPDGKCICQGLFDDDDLEPSEEMDQDDEPLYWSEIIYIFGERFDVPRSRQIGMHRIEMLGCNLQVWASNEPENDDVLSRAYTIAQQAVAKYYADILSGVYV
jgi:GIY-YIG catalytic domain